MFMGKTEEILAEVKVEGDAGIRKRNCQLKEYPSFKLSTRRIRFNKSTVTNK